jgi:hypothetical protein
MQGCAAIEWMPPACERLSASRALGPGAGPWTRRLECASLPAAAFPEAEPPAAIRRARHIEAAGNATCEAIRELSQSGEAPRCHALTGKGPGSRAQRSPGDADGWVAHQSRKRRAVWRVPAPAKAGVPPAGCGARALSAQANRAPHAAKPHNWTWGQAGPSLGWMPAATEPTP